MLPIPQVAWWRAHAVAVVDDNCGITDWAENAEKSAQQERYARSHADAAEKRAELAERTLKEVMGAAVVTNFGEHDATKCKLCGAENIDHARFRHKDGCTLPRAKHGATGAGKEIAKP